MHTTARRSILLSFGVWMLIGAGTQTWLWVPGSALGTAGVFVLIAGLIVAAVATGTPDPNEELSVRRTRAEYGQHVNDAVAWVKSQRAEGAENLEDLVLQDVWTRVK